MPIESTETPIEAPTDGLLAYCRPGFEPELAAELSERAALAGFSGESETWGRGVVALIPPDGDETQVRSITFPIGIPAVWTDIAFAGGDRIYVGGYIRFNVYWEFAVARLLPDLTPDPTFGDAGLTRFDASGAGHDSGVTSLALDALGHPVVAGWVATNGNAAYAVARLQS